LGDFANATQNIEKSLDLALTNQDTARVAHAYNLLADIRYRQARFENVEHITDQVIALGQNVPPRELALAYLWSGMSSSAIGKYDAALARLQRAEELCLRIQNNQQLARVLEATAFVYYQQKNLQAALHAMKRSVELSRSFSTPMNLASSLNNIALIQHQLGQSKEALETLTESIELARETSRNFYARFIGNRVEVHTYLGNFSEAQADFEEAINLYMSMDDEQALVELYLVMGYEHHCRLEQWEDAQDCFSKAQELINQRPEDYTERLARLHIGMGQIKLRTGSIKQAHHLFQSANAIIEDKNIAWWRPIALYSLGLAKRQQGDVELARQDFLQAINAIDNEGCPDYLPLLYLELAQMEHDPTSRRAYLKNCLEAADLRSRILDKLNCFKLAGNLLLSEKEESWRALGKRYLARAETIASQLNQTKMA
jgi:tetratricopeptide (TPR) repeat protein